MATSIYGPQLGSFSGSSGSGPSSGSGSRSGSSNSSLSEVGHLSVHVSADHFGTRSSSLSPPSLQSSFRTPCGTSSAHLRLLVEATRTEEAVKDKIALSAQTIQSINAKASEISAEIREMSRKFRAAIEARERKLLCQVDRICVAKTNSLKEYSKEMQSVVFRCSQVTNLVADVLNSHSSRVPSNVDLEGVRRQLNKLRITPTIPENMNTFDFVAPDHITLLAAFSSMGSVICDGYAPTTRAMGEGITKAVKGRRTTVTVTVHNHLGEPRSSGRDLVMGALLAPDGSCAPVEVDDRNDGLYLLRYTPTVEGSNSLHITLRGRHIQGSPFPVTVITGNFSNSSSNNNSSSCNIKRIPSFSFGGEGSADGQFLRPWGICSDRQGRLIVADRSNNRIQVFNQDGKFLFKFGSQGSAAGQFDRPAGLATDRAGRIIVADKDNHRVQVFTSEGQFILTFGEVGSKNGQFNYPWDVDVNSSGQIVVSDTRNHRIQLFTPDGKYLNKYGFETASVMWKHFDSPRGVCFNPKGFVIVTDFNNHRLVVVEPQFRGARFLGTEGSGLKQFQRPQGVAVDADGRIIVSDSRNNRLQIFEENGTVVCQIADIEMDRPSGVCVTPTGKIAVVDFGNNRVLVF